MKRRFLLVGCIAILFLVVSCKKEESTSIVETEKDVFQNIIDSVYQTNQGAVGIIVHIESPNKNISWSGAVGLQSKNDTIKIEANQPVNLASNTKTYVAATILRLVEQNKVSLDDSIVHLVSDTSKEVLKNDGYDLSKIKVKHLLSHTSGVFDYVSTELFDTRENNEPSYQWNRDEQIKLAMDEGDPLGSPESVFSYSDTNYLLLAEIIEKLSGRPFYTAMRELLNYNTHDLNNTWFMTLEEAPKGSKKLINQYNDNFDSSIENVSFDLYGGGGIASNMTELAQFMQLLFEGKLFENSETKDLMFTEVRLDDKKENNYRMGVHKYKLDDTSENTGWAHGGFWGTFAVYFPETNTSIAISVSNANMKRNVQTPILKKIIEELKKK